MNFNLFNKNKAFSLVELSLVMLVLGFLIVGVMSGRTIMYRSQAQNIVSSIDQYKKAVTIFYDTYGAMPDALSVEKCQESGELSSLQFCNNSTGNEKPPIANTATNFFGSNYYAAQNSAAPKNRFGQYSNLWSAKVLQAVNLVSGVKDMSPKSYSYGSDPMDYGKNGDLKSYGVAYFYGIQSSFDKDAYFQFNYITNAANASSNLSRGISFFEFTATTTNSIKQNFIDNNSIALFNNNKYDQNLCPSLWSNLAGVGGAGTGGWSGGVFSNCQTGVGAVTAYVARVVDQKIDDGKPSTGNVISTKGYYPASESDQGYCYDASPISNAALYENAKYINTNVNSRKHGCNMLFALPKFNI